MIGDTVKEGEVLMTLYTKKEAPDVNIDNIFTIDEKTVWEELVKNILKSIDKESISFEPCNLPDDKNAVVIADRTAADIWQEIEKMDIGFRKYLTEYVGKRLNNYLSTIFDDVKIKNGKKG